LTIISKNLKLNWRLGSPKEALDRQIHSVNRVALSEIDADVAQTKLIEQEYWRIQYEKKLQEIKELEVEYEKIKAKLDPGAMTGNPGGVATTRDAAKLKKNIAQNAHRRELKGDKEAAEKHRLKTNEQQNKSSRERAKHATTAEKELALNNRKKADAKYRAGERGRASGRKSSEKYRKKVKSDKSKAAGIKPST
jgi:hypothetical protein